MSDSPKAMTSTETAALKACPFCGKDVELREGHDNSWIAHEGCPADIGSFEDVTDLVDCWNTRAALSEPAQDGWQDISTAPRDGTPIIGYWEIYKRPCVMWWNSADNAFESWADRKEAPTHWTPLPSSPSIKGGE